MTGSVQLHRRNLFRNSKEEPGLILVPVWEFQGPVWSQYFLVELESDTVITVICGEDKTPKYNIDRQTDRQTDLIRFDR